LTQRQRGRPHYGSIQRNETIAGVVITFFEFIKSFDLGQLKQELFNRINACSFAKSGNG